MKKTNQCPKCGSQKITTAAVYGYDIRLGMTKLSALDVTQFICTDCGYSEQWLNRGSLIRAKTHYEKNNADKE